MPAPQAPSRTVVPGVRAAQTPGSATSATARSRILPPALPGRRNGPAPGDERELGLAPARSGHLLGGQRFGDLLQRLLLGVDAEDELEDPADDHQGGPEVVAEGDLAQLAGADQLREQVRPDDPAEPRTDRVESAIAIARVSIGKISSPSGRPRSCRPRRRRRSRTRPASASTPQHALREQAAVRPAAARADVRR